ncbi:YugN family protein [Bacillus testis]|uniref:YugN family protein n=1 Tax=Bacillus testis TaxID=1622072 RepID=UPI00067F2279|nr:YugN family protein [Bacillus testis]
MRFEDTGLEQLQAEINRLDEVMQEHGLIRAEQWDYERVNYDRKFEINNDVYYLRVQGYAVEGDVGAHRAIIQLIVPLLGKHYYPHGLEYGEGEYFPPDLVRKCEEILTSVTKEVEAFALHR